MANIVVMATIMVMSILEALAKGGGGGGSCPLVGEGPELGFG